MLLEGQPVADDRGVDRRAPRDLVDAVRSVVCCGKRLVGGVQEDGASADSRCQASGKHRQGKCPGAIRLGALALQRQGIGAGKVNNPALLRLGRDESNLFAVGRCHCYTSQFHGCSSKSLIRYVQYRIGFTELQ
ncbi:hypothetical protein SRABI128_06026 [Microbacterium sp. Bi128]|nr:hypothetical protein SRABI128_06026 [Microbacterium sp. Bi128]